MYISCLFPEYVGQDEALTSTPCTKRLFPVLSHQERHGLKQKLPHQADGLACWMMIHCLMLILLFPNLRWFLAKLLNLL